MENNDSIKKTKMTQRIRVQYYQSLGASCQGIQYSLDMQAETYDKALKYLTNIMNTCGGVITLTTIEKIEP